MLVLRRKPNEAVRVYDPDTGRALWVHVLSVRRGVVYLGFSGPREVLVDREEHLHDLGEGEPCRA